MITVLPGDVYYSSQSIIFNPVSVIDTRRGFLNKVRKLFPFVYSEFLDKIEDAEEKELLGDIQLVYIGNKQLIMNGFCINSRGDINNFAFCKNMVELCNLAYEYNLSVGIEYGLGEYDIEEIANIDLIIRTVFEDTDIDVRLYDRRNYYIV